MRQATESAAVFVRCGAGSGPGSGDDERGGQDARVKAASALGERLGATPDDAAPDCAVVRVVGAGGAEMSDAAGEPSRAICQAG